ncbi:MAG: RNase adapter RapZ [Terriglobales bacterium]
MPSAKPSNSHGTAPSPQREPRRSASEARQRHKILHTRDGHPQYGGTELVIITGMSGSGKVSALKVFEDLGFYCVDNLPVDLLPNFAELAWASSEIEKCALVADVREGPSLKRLPEIVQELKHRLKTTVVYLEASDESLIRRFSETRRPHPLGTETPVKASIQSERRQLLPIRRMADVVIDTSKFNVHELRQYITQRFQPEPSNKPVLVSVVSFGYRHGVPEEADLLFDVRFLPNPHFVPEFRPYSGKHPKVAKYIRSFPQTQEFISRISELLIYLLPHYVEEGKSYLTIGFGCTGGQHRSVLIAQEVFKRLQKAGYRVKVTHRDCPK